MFPKDDLLAFWKLGDLIDSRGNRYTLTNNGGVQFVAGKIGNCAEFATSSQKLQSDVVVNTQDTAYSIAFWAYPTALPTWGVGLMMLGPNTPGTLCLTHTIDGNAGIGFTPTMTASLPLNEWTHLAWSINSSGQASFYKNGTFVGTSDDQVTVNLSEICLCSEASDQRFQGKLDAVGIWTRALTLQEVQALYNNGNGLEPEGILFLEDSSTNDFQLTLNGDAQLNTTITKYGSGSAYFDEASVIQLPVGQESLSLGAGNFTVELWVYPSGQQGQYGHLVNWRGPGGAGDNIDHGSLTFDSVNKRLNWYTSQVILNSTDNSVLENTWTHVAMVRSGSSLSFYIDGNLNATTDIGSQSYEYNTYGITLGGLPNIQESFKGYIDDLRITKGIARYTANFTPPQQQLPAPSDPYQDNVQLLLHMDNNQFVDASLNNFTLETFGNPQISTSTIKYGNGAGYFNGLNHIKISNFLNFASQDWTIEFWLNVGVTVDKDILGNAGQEENNNVTTGLNILINTSQFITYSTDGVTSTSVGTSYTPYWNKWTHIALVRLNSVISMYVNGVLAGSPTDVMPGTANFLYIGRSNYAGYNFTGHIDELRITKGVARYTSNFVPHTAPFVNPST